MGKIKRPELVNMIIFAFGRYIDYRLTETKEELIEQFGPIDYMSPVLDFGKFTHYYNKEMGDGRIDGRLISFQNLIHPAELSHIKLCTNEIEERHMEEGKRTINLDSGYVHHSQFVLASTKGQGNRLYIGKGIFAEITLFFVNGAYQPLPYTYPSYADKQYIEEITTIRKAFLLKRKS
jgi:hypothetical protein